MRIVCRISQTRDLSARIIIYERSRLVTIVCNGHYARPRRNCYLLRNIANWPITVYALKTRAPLVALTVCATRYGCASKFHIIIELRVSSSVNHPFTPIVLA